MVFTIQIEIQFITQSTVIQYIKNRYKCTYVKTMSFCVILGILPDVSITGTTSTDNSITVNIGTIPSGINKVIIGYHRLDLGVPVVGEYVNNGRGSSRTFSSLVPGAKYRITAWGLGGGGDRRRSQSPAVREVTTMEKSELMHSDVTVSKIIINIGVGAGASGMVLAAPLFASPLRFSINVYNLSVNVARIQPTIVQIIFINANSKRILGYHNSMRNMK